MAIAQNFPTIKPSLLLDFANTGSLDPRITFSRASTGTYYNGVTTAKAEENLLTYSQEFDNAAWLRSSGMTITANVTNAPDGNPTADQVTASSSASSQNWVNQAAISGNRIWSIYAKAGTHSFIQMLIATDTAPYANFNLSTGTVTQTGTNISASMVESPIGSGWYRCICVITSATGGASCYVSLIPNGTAARATLWTAAGTETVYLWGAQVEQRSSVTAYTATTTQPITNYIPVLQTAAANVARFDHNPTTGEALGLLIEEQRTNLVTYSADFSNAAWTATNSTISANTVVAPDGTLSADSISETTATGTHRIRTASISVSASTSYTCTVYAKAGFGATRYFGIALSDSTSISTGARRSYIFDLSNGTATSTGGATWTLVSGSATAVGNGWYRCQITVTTDAGASTMYVSIGLADSFSTTSFTAGYTGDGYSGIFIWGAQFEAGAFPTSYIATTSAQVTRSADAASMTGTNFSSWYRQDEGTVYADFIKYGAGITSGGGASTPRVWNIDDGTSSIQLRFNSSVTIESTTSGSIYMALPWVAGSVNKAAVAYQTNNAAFAVNSSVTTDVAGSAPTTLNSMKLGSNTAATGGFLNGHIRRISYYPARLTNAQLQALTS